MKSTIRKIISTSAVSALAFSALAQDTPTSTSGRSVYGNDDNIPEGSEYKKDRPGDRNRASRASQTEQIQGVEKASDLIGMKVLNHQDEKIGTVKDFVIDVESGRIVALVVSSGGFLGIGNELSAVPPKAFRFNKDRDALQLNATKEMLTKAPHFNADQWPDFGQPEYSDQVYRAYQIEPYFKTNATTKVDGTVRNVRDQNNEALTATDQGNSEADLDTTTGNVRDRKEESLTASDQGNSEADVSATAQIRKEVNASKNMSVSGKNVTIITRDGKVTLRGRVDSADEKKTIGEIATRIVRFGNVDNQLEVKSNALTTTSSIN